MEEFPLFDYVNTTDPSVTDTALCFTAIHLAAYLDHVPMVRWLLYKVCNKTFNDLQGDHNVEKVEIDSLEN